MSRRAAWQRGWTATFVAMVGLVVLTSGQLVSAEDSYRADRFVVADRKKDQVRPRVSGSWVVWKDYRNLPARAVDDSPNGEIFARDLATDEEIDVAQANKNTDPAISGTLIVWTSGRGKTTEILGMDLQNRQIAVVSFSPADQERPAISETLVVWQDKRNGNWDIYARDLTQADDIAITEQVEDQVRPAVSGRIVVWEDWRDRAAGPDVVARDLDADRTVRLTGNHDAFEPAVSGRWVVWVGMRDQAVFVHNLDDGKTTRITAAAGPKSQPAISGDLVVWTDERHGDRDVYGYDLVTGTEFEISRADAIQDDPHIDGTTVVWSDARGPNRDIVGAQLTLPRPLETTACR